MPPHLLFSINLIIQLQQTRHSSALFHARPSTKTLISQLSSFSTHPSFHHRPTVALSRSSRKASGNWPSQSQAQVQKTPSHLIRQVRPTRPTPNNQRIPMTLSSHQTSKQLSRSCHLRLLGVWLW
ncbi:hypothetical protein BLNAU_16098 [Blattamonas nauphoetae]|uniref:Uncharacterized protein n=1 Tax=Blattamonas nauphoetae TaxID=2049346 RepID=A0ABQ9XCH3_9EUKA|nr:hypothetical protein BLNAU_16098 [Blattamonas nauphoetae]